MSKEEIVNNIIDDDKEGYFGENKVLAFFVEQGTKKALRETGIVAWDDTTTANCIYLKYLDGRIDKINQTDKTILTAQSSGTWANRATTNVYTEGGV